MFTAAAGWRLLLPKCRHLLGKKKSTPSFEVITLFQQDVANFSFRLCEGIVSPPVPFLPPPSTITAIYLHSVQSRTPAISPHSPLAPPMLFNPRSEIGSRAVNFSSWGSEFIASSWHHRHHHLMCSGESWADPRWRQQGAEGPPSLGCTYEIGFKIQVHNEWPRQYLLCDLCSGQKSWLPPELDAVIPVVSLGDDTGLCWNLPRTSVWERPGVRRSVSGPEPRRSSGHGLWPSRGAGRPGRSCLLQEVEEGEAAHAGERRDLLPVSLNEPIDWNICESTPFSTLPPAGLHEWFCLQQRKHLVRFFFFCCFFCHCAPCARYHFKRIKTRASWVFASFFFFNQQSATFHQLKYMPLDHWWAS